MRVLILAAAPLAALLALGIVGCGNNTASPSRSATWDGDERGTSYYELSRDPRYYAPPGSLDREDARHQPYSSIGE